MIKVSKGTPNHIIMRIQMNWDENQTLDLGRTRKARMTVDKIRKPDSGEYKARNNP